MTFRFLRRFLDACLSEGERRINGNAPGPVPPASFQTADRLFLLMPFYSVWLLYARLLPSALQINLFGEFCSPLETWLVAPGGFQEAFFWRVFARNQQFPLSRMYATRTGGFIPRRLPIAFHFSSTSPYAIFPRPTVRWSRWLCFFLSRNFNGFAVSCICGFRNQKSMCLRGSHLPSHFRCTDLIILL